MRAPAGDLRWRGNAQRPLETAQPKIAIAAVVAEYTRWRNGPVNSSLLVQHTDCRSDSTKSLPYPSPSGGRGNIPKPCPTAALLQHRGERLSLACVEYDIKPLVLCSEIFETHEIVVCS